MFSPNFRYTDKIVRNLTLIAEARAIILNASLVLDKLNIPGGESLPNGLRPVETTSRRDVTATPFKVVGEVSQIKGLTKQYGLSPKKAGLEISNVKG